MEVDRCPGILLPVEGDKLYNKNVSLESFIMEENRNGKKKGERR